MSPTTPTRRARNATTAAIRALLTAAAVLFAAAAPASGADDPRVMYDSEQSPPGLWTRSLDGSDPQPFYAGAYGSSWSANGAKMAYQTGDTFCNVGADIGEVKVMNADKSNVTTLGEGCDARISPDGTKVAYSPGGSTINVVGTTPGSVPQTIISNGSSNPGCNTIANDDLRVDCKIPAWPTWKGNGTITYVGGTGKALWSIPAAGGSSSLVAGTDQPTAHIAWLNGISGSNDGTKIVASGTLLSCFSCGEGIYSIPGNTLIATPGSSTHAYVYPQFSFDGTKVVFTERDSSVAGNPSHIYVIDAAGGPKTLASGTDTTAVNPSFAPPGSSGTIQGAVTGRDDAPLGGVTLTMTRSGGSPVTTTTDSDGTYAANVSATAWTVTASGTPAGQDPDGHFSVKTCSGTSPQAGECVVDVAPGAASTASFSYGKNRLTGTITYGRGFKGPVKKMSVDILGTTTEGEHINTTVTTGDDGKYSKDLDAGTYKVLPDPAFAPAASGGACTDGASTCTITLDKDLTADFTVACQPTIDFHTSMIATGCFVPVDAAAHTWQALGPFRMNGIDFESSDDQANPVFFDEQAKRVDGNDVKLSLSAPGWGGGWLAFFVPGGLHVEFPFTEQKTTWALSTPWSTPAGLLSRGVGFLYTAVGSSSTLFGFPAHAPAVELSFTPGKTVLTMQLTFPPKRSAFLDPINGLWKVPTADGARIAYPLAYRATVTTTNDVGVSQIGGTFAPSAAYGVDTNTRKFVRTTGPPATGTVELARIGFVWQLAAGAFETTALLVIHGKPTDKARAFVKPLQGFLGQTLVTVGAVFKWVTAIEVGDTTVAIPGITNLSVNVNSINKYVPDTPGFFWQRFGLNGGIDIGNPLGAVRLGGNVGFSWLPRFKSDSLWFQEVVTLDGAGGIAFDPFSFGGTSDLKIAEATIVHGELKLNSAGLDLNGEAGLDLNQILRFRFPASLKGVGRLSVPMADGKFLPGWQLEAGGKMDVWSLTGDGRFILNGKGAGLCVTSNRIGTRGAFFDDEWHVGGCEEGPFSTAGSAGAKSTAGTGTNDDKRAIVAAAEAPSFTLTRRSHVSAVAVPGAGGPPRFELRGPGGLHMTTPADGTALIGSRAALIQNAGDNTTYILLRGAARGRYTLTPLDGAPAIRGLRFSSPLPSPSVHARVTYQGCGRTVRWRLRPLPGQQVVISEQTGDAVRPLVQTNRARGKLTYTPDESGGAKRRIVAVVLQQGTPRKTIQLARFRTPTGTPPAKVRHLKARRKGAKVRLKWSPVCAATEYYVTVGRGAEQTATVPAKPRATIKLAKTKRGTPVTVTAVGPTGQGGKAARIKVR